MKSVFYFSSLFFSTSFGSNWNKTHPMPIRDKSTAPCIAYCHFGTCENGQLILFNSSPIYSSHWKQHQQIGNHLIVPMNRRFQRRISKRFLETNNYSIVFLFWGVSFDCMVASLDCTGSINSRPISCLTSFKVINLKKDFVWVVFKIYFLYIFRELQLRWWDKTCNLWNESMLGGFWYRVRQGLHQVGAWWSNDIVL